MNGATDQGLDRPSTAPHPPRSMPAGAASRPDAPLEAPLARAGQRLVAVVAHPDDETFGCGSLLAQSAAAGAEVVVICATRGEAGERRPDPTTDAWPLGLLREFELCQAAEVLGVSDVVLLDHHDSGFDGPPPTGALVEVPHDDLVSELTDQLASLDPDVVLTLDGCDGHRDHIKVRDAVTESVTRLRRPPRLVHSSLPNSLMRAWAAAMADLDPDTAYLRIDLDQLGRPDHELVALDTSEVLEVRERALACHRSQTSPYHGIPEALRRAFLTTDHVVDVTPVHDNRPGHRSPMPA